MEPALNPSLVSVRYVPPQTVPPQIRRGYSFKFPGFICRDNNEENPPLNAGVENSSLNENTILILRDTTTTTATTTTTTTTATTTTTTTTTALFTTLHGPAQKIRKVNKILNGLKPERIHLRCPVTLFYAYKLNIPCTFAASSQPPLS
ncbi:hypothetical protein PNOK_0866300 [Pyrrhoderma noxium]|uniref:Uncharacterized protein n=1 Tax=Pyrrhoderma noxium TaxID=2282107 RepID=A0A286U8B9_9AGAM|nr:hypothetical protein PNOK_0866300 [Pyrrhoderma noxium]